MNIRHEVLEWFGRSRGVIAIRLVLMYYAIEIYSSFFLSGSFGGGVEDVLDVDLSFLFIVVKSSHRI
jgi:hypothetical protein